MKTKKTKGYTLHWKFMEPYNFFIVVATGPDIAGIRKELRRDFDKSKASNEPMPEEYLEETEREFLNGGHLPAGRCIFNDRSDNIVIYCPKMQPSSFTLAHELYHAVRKSAKCFGFEGPGDEAEAYLFERALEYFTEKLAKDRRKHTR